jgi:hypothetical protein
MEFLSLFWNFDADNKTKFIFSVFVVIIFLCLFCRPKGSNNSNQLEMFNKINSVLKGDEWNKKREKKFKNKLTNCQIDYKLCKENLKRGNINSLMCQTCQPNGDYPSKIYHQNLGWIKVNTKTGKPL